MNGTDQVVLLATNASDLIVEPVIDAATNASANVTSGITSLLPLSQIYTVIDPLVGNGYMQNSLNFFFFGTILETGRRLWQWIMDQFTQGFVLTAIFDSSDPAYEWFFAYLNDEKIWATTREFHVSAKTNSRTWGVNSAKTGDQQDNKCAQYLPTYDKPQLFRFKQTWCQVARQKSASTHNYEHEDGGALILTLYTRKRAVLDDLIQEARERWLANSKKSRLVVHNSCSCGSFCQSTTKARRPLDSLILPTGVKETLVSDARDFLRSEQWYSDAGIQHKRGYLLYGPPGTGKSSTVHALAGELDLEIYTLSLATNGLDDMGLARLVGSTPAHSIILIEDIDCAFPSREEKERKKEALEKGIILADTRSSITLSGLLNVIDGCSSEEGRLLFATTNYVNRLDPALLRPGRMDVKLHYKMSTRDQIIALFKRFYPAIPDEDVTEKDMEKAEAQREKAEAQSKKARRRISDINLNQLTPPPTPSLLSTTTSPSTPEVKPSATLEEEVEVEEVESESGMVDLNPSIAVSDKFTMDTTPIYPPRLPRAEVDALATRFADTVPPNVYTVAELQGFLLTLKTRPYEAVERVVSWMREMEEERERLKRREEEEQAREKEEREKKEKEKAGGSSSSTTTTAASTTTTPLPPPPPPPAPVTAPLTPALPVVADSANVTLPSVTDASPAKEDKAVETTATVA